MKQNVISVLIGYLIFAVLFLPVLLIKDSLWVSVAFLFTIVISIVIGQLIKPIILKYIK